MSLIKRATAEFIGTFWLVLGGCGSAVLAAAFPPVGIGLLGVALAFGLTVLTMAYAIGHISGCHLNPAVSFGLLVGGRFKGSDLPAYVIAQVLGAIVAASLLYVIASGKAGFDLSAGLAANGYGEHSSGGYSLGSALLTEVIMTFMFLIVILGATDARAAGVCANCDWTRAHAHSSNQHSGHQHVCEPRAQHGSCPHRRRLATLTVVDVLGRAACRCGTRGRRIRRL